MARINPSSHEMGILCRAFHEKNVAQALIFFQSLHDMNGRLILTDPSYEDVRAILEVGLGRPQVGQVYFGGSPLMTVSREGQP